MSTNKAPTTHSAPFATASLATATSFAALLGLLHLLKSDLDPSWHFISEYAIGTHGWIMILGFLTLATAFVTLERAVKPFLSGRLAAIGRVCLFVSAAGLTVGAVFVSDPITTSKQDATWHGQLHSIGGTLGLAMPIAVAIVGWKLSRHPRLRAHARLLRTSTIIAFASSVLAAGSIGALVSDNDGQFGPDVLVGWPNRLEIIAIAAWIVITAGTVRHASGTTPQTLRSGDRSEYAAING
jgi:hypothetical protein